MTTDIPAPFHSLSISKHFVNKWQPIFRDVTGIKVGLAWSGRRTHGNDQYRSISLETLLPLFEIEGIHYVSLQKEVSDHDAHLLKELPQMVHLGEKLEDFSDTAAIISQLDIIITVDTAVLHLAGSLGKPVCGLIPFRPDWRWLADRTDSPWYPMLKLYRQPLLNEWSNVVQNVCEDLRILSGHKNQKIPNSRITRSSQNKNSSPTFSAQLSRTESLALILHRIQNRNFKSAIHLCQQMAAIDFEDFTFDALIAYIYHVTGAQEDEKACWGKIGTIDKAGLVHLQNKLIEDMHEYTRDNLMVIKNFLNSLAAQTSEPGLLQQNIWKIEKLTGLNKAYFSEAGQDLFVDQTLLKQKPDGVFVDIGAFDGFTGSNTLFFEKFRGWAGICIEASPTYFRPLAKLRSAECINVAISNTEGEASFFEITRGLEQMSSLTENLPDNMQEISKKRGDFEGREITVPTATFGKIAKDRSLKYVDYCSIDVEGGEMKVLEGIDFDYTDIHIFSVENIQSRSNDFERIRTFLRDRNYTLLKKIGADDMFVKS